VATKPEAGTMTSAAAIAGLDALPLMAAMAVMIVSSDHSAIISIAA
jgi:hypothetical protein